eukprot:c170_g1_i1 orf=519-839(-)
MNVCHMSISMYDCPLVHMNASLCLSVCDNTIYPKHIISTKESTHNTPAAFAVSKSSHDCLHVHMNVSICLSMCPNTLPSETHPQHQENFLQYPCNVYFFRVSAKTT